MVNRALIAHWRMPHRRKYTKINLHVVLMRTSMLAVLETKLDGWNSRLTAGGSKGNERKEKTCREKEKKWVGWDSGCFYKVTFGNYKFVIE